MGNKEDKKRKEVEISEGGLKFLALGAARDHRPLKNYMEKVLEDKANEIRIKDLDKVSPRKY